MSSGLLLVGLTVDDVVAFSGAYRAVCPAEGPPVDVTHLSDALGVLAAASFGVVVAGAGAAPGGWDAAGEELRRLAPNAALIAMTAGVTGPVWDDVVRPTERDPALLVRVLRSGFAIARALDRLARWAMRDPLTDLLNRRGLERVLLRESSGRERGGGPLVALLVDCDDFKRINDQFGMSTGDDVLRRLAEVLNRCLRGRDTVARVGGDEFLVLLPHTRTFEAVEVAHRIRLEVRERVRLPDDTSLTLSIGVRRLDASMSRLQDVVEATQEGLRRSKRGGKDQVRLVDRSGQEATVEVGGPAPNPGPLLHRALEVRELNHGAPVRRLLVPDLPDEQAVVVTTHRATHGPLDLAWVERGLAVATPDLPVQVALFPGTVLEQPTVSIRATLPPRLDPSMVTLAIDDQYLTGNPSIVAKRLVPLREFGLTVALEVSDLGRACLEALILIRPEWVVLDGSLVVDIGTSRHKRSSLARFVELCAVLGAEIVALRLDAETDLQAAREVGIRYGAGEAVPGPSSTIEVAGG